MQATRSSIVSSLRWISIAKLSGQVLNWGMTFVVLRLLVPDDYGLMAMATVFVSFMYMFADLGLGVAVIQARDCPKERLAEVFGAMLLLNVSLCLLLMLAAPLISQFFNEPRLTAVLRVLSLQFVLGALASIPRAMLQREMHFKVFSMIEVSGALVSGLTTIVMAWLGYGVWALVGGTLASTIWSGVWVNLAAPLRIWPRFTFAESRQLLAIGGNVTLSRVMWFFMSQADVFIVGKVLGKEALGFYSVAIQLSAMPMNKVMTIINQVALTGFARIQDDKETVIRSIVAGVGVISFIAFPLFWGMSSVAQEIVAVVLGAKWSQAALPLQLIPLIIPLRMLGSYMSTAVQGIGRPDIDVRNTFQGMLLMPPAFYVGCLFGLPGVSIAWLLVVPLLFVGNMKRLLEAAGVPLQDFYANLKLPLAISLGMYAMVALIRYLLPLDVGAVVSLVLLVATGATAYAGTFWVVGRERFLNVLRVVRG